MKNRLITLAAAGLTGSLLFAGAGVAGSGNGDNNDPGDTYRSKFSDAEASSRACNDEVDTVYYLGPELLWPPNHKLGAPSNITAVADDAAPGDGTTDDQEETVTLETNVTSDEDLNANGDGNTDADYNEPQTDGPNNTGTAATTQQVRAERAGGGDGRTYTIDFLAEFEDEDGNMYVCTSQADYEGGGESVVVRPPFTVTVPHDMSDPAIREQRTNGNGNG